MNVNTTRTIDPKVLCGVIRKFMASGFDSRIAMRRISIAEGSTSNPNAAVIRSVKPHDP